MDNKSTNNGTKSQKCQLCEKCFKKPSELKYHIDRKHPNQNNNPTEECTIIKSISHSQELNEDYAVPMLALEKSISDLNAVIRNNVKTVGDFKALKKIVASIEPTLQAIQESKTRKNSLLTNEKPIAILSLTEEVSNFFFPDPFIFFNLTNEGVSSR
ncbi:unnamed protein product [Ceutorhynchus assimilis]|uniref:C2H2-type domain-containing protein n=1 Tax=Ceutorhynchus assimilis TaxID=467358 RepID=A0A9N9QIA0_9CUCU|nr:unnamed protein product [Ceutorhynchus assimilis]